MSIINIDTEQIERFAKRGGKLVFKKSAEESLLRLLELRDMLDKTIEETKKNISQAGLQLDRNFKGVVGEHIKAIYRVYGSRYTYDKEMFDVAKDYLKQTKRYTVDGKAVDEYFEKHGVLPEGIRLKDRQPVISLSRTNDTQTPPLIQPLKSLDEGKK